MKSLLDGGELFTVSRATPRCLSESGADCDGRRVIIEELQMLVTASSACRDARLALGDHDWRTVAEDAGVGVVIPI